MSARPFQMKQVANENGRQAEIIMAQYALIAAVMHIIGNQTKNVMNVKSANMDKV
jgi:hypothetical protein